MTYLTIEENLKPFLQRQIVIQVGTKIIREGKLILFNLKDYFLVLTLKIRGRNKTYEIPYPFTNAVVGDLCLQLDYRLINLHGGEPDILKHKIFCLSKKSKFYDSVVEIKACQTS